MQQIISFALVGLVINALTAHSFTPSPHNNNMRLATHQIIVSANIRNSNLYSMPDDDYPSDYDPEDLESVEKKVSVDMVSNCCSHYI